MSRGRFTALAAGLAACVALATPSRATATDGAAIATRERPSDARITAAAQTAFSRAQGIDSRIGSDVADGVVLLHGMVASESERTRVVAVTSRVPGVRAIRDVLRIVPGDEQRALALQDAFVAGRVSVALSHDEDLWDSHVGVHAVSDGVVVLGGEVATIELHEKAIELASQVDGVRRVASLVRSGDPERDLALWARTAALESVRERSRVRAAFSDAWARTRIGLALLIEPGLLPTRVDVDVRDGIVTLFGTVASRGERDAALERALRVDGVLFVDNDLQVIPESVAETVESADASLKDDIEQRIEGEQLENADIAVEVANATVRLEGVVASHSDRMKAIRLASSTDGVRGLSDGLEVRSDG